MISSSALVQRQFIVRKYREGYDMLEVDLFLNRVEESLKIYENGRSMLTTGSTEILTSAQVMAEKFTATKFKSGYDVAMVDDLLDEVCLTLKHYEKSGYAAN